jgi:hypothetical protein
MCSNRNHVCWNTWQVTCVYTHTHTHTYTHTHTHTHTMRALAPQCAFRDKLYVCICIFNYDGAVQLLPVSRLVITWSNIKPRTHFSILPQRNSVTWSRGVLLAPRFGFGRDGAHSGERAARCDPPVFAAPAGKMSSLKVASAVFIFVHNMSSRRRKRRERRWWQKELYRKRSVYSGTVS